VHSNWSNLQVWVCTYPSLYSYTDDLLQFYILGMIQELDYCFIQLYTKRNM